MAKFELQDKIILDTSTCLEEQNAQLKKEIGNLRSKTEEPTQQPPINSEFDLIKKKVVNLNRQDL